MRRAATVLAVAALAACAPLPPTPGPDAVPPRAGPAPAPDAGPRQVAIARQEKLARAARDAGDLRSALEHYEVLVLVDPDNPAYRDALRATRAAIEDGVQDQLRAAHAARRAGDVGKAREAWLRVLVLDSSNAEAARALRELEQQAMARTQADRAARARSMDEVVANAKARAVAESAQGNGAASADLDQRL
ncbi:MAG TPA: hypothetical protein VFX05_03480, partial [Casimicrobiaceae bacterium]|nr:hypothetical protein [Casimicrobiaceae bacterium]